VAFLPSPLAPFANIYLQYLGRSKHHDVVCSHWLQRTGMPQSGIAVHPATDPSCARLPVLQCPPADGSSPPNMNLIYEASYLFFHVRFSTIPLKFMVLQEI
jgi:hypothetical protein